MLTENTEDPTARDVIRKLGSLPLAIAQAGAYIAVHQISFTRYLEIYEKYFNRIAAKKPLEWDYGDRTVWTTWEISFEAIKKADGRAAELLSLCSFFANENIRDEMLRRGGALKGDGKFTFRPASAQGKVLAGLFADSLRE